MSTNELNELRESIKANGVLIEEFVKDFEELKKEIKEEEVENIHEGQQQLGNGDWVDEDLAVFTEDTNEWILLEDAVFIENPEGYYSQDVDYDTSVGGVTATEDFARRNWYRTEDTDEWYEDTDDLYYVQNYGIAGYYADQESVRWWDNEQEWVTSRFCDRNLYYWESDGEYHSEYEEEEEQDSNGLRQYHHSQDVGYHTTPEAREIKGWLFGVEVEKAETLENWSWDEVNDACHWSAEQDSSVAGEYVSCVYALDNWKHHLENSMINRILELDVDGDCGGHMTFSNPNLSDEEIQARILNFVSIIFAMYPLRQNNSYCAVPENFENLFTARREAINRKRRGLYEFRIFPGVATKKQLVFRADLMLYFLTSEKSFDEHILSAKFKDGELKEILHRVYDQDKLDELIKRACKMQDRMTSCSEGATFEKLSQHWLKEVK